MPALYDDMGLRFMYPDNWTLGERGEDEAAGVTLEMPNGGFLSIDAAADSLDDQEVVEEVQRIIAEEYSEVEQEEMPCKNDAFVRMVDFRFYYLDLLILSRLILLTAKGNRLLIQIQSEDRDFTENERVFDAILLQITGTA